MTQSTIESFYALGLGFALAGMLVSGFETLGRERLGLSALRGRTFPALICVPVLAFSAPMLILRNVTTGRRSGFGHLPLVLVATVAAGFWSLMSGRVVFDIARYVAGA